MTLKELLAAGIAAYTGGSVTELKTYADPKVSGTYALRADVVTEGGKPAVLDFIIIGNCIPGGFRRALREKDAEVVAENLEDFQFETWPPRSGALRFA